jgi:hypothetical protein
MRNNRNRRHRSNPNNQSNDMDRNYRNNQNNNKEANNSNTRDASNVTQAANQHPMTGSRSSRDQVSKNSRDQVSKNSQNQVNQNEQNTNQPESNQENLKKCTLCNKIIKEMNTAIKHKNEDEDEYLHFDCAVRDIREKEKPYPNEKICYLGKGSFGIVKFLSYSSSPIKFLIKKRIQYETLE